MKSSCFRVPQVFLALAMCMLLFGCAPTTRMATNKAQTYAGDPKRIYAVFSVRAQFGKDFSEGFEQKAIAIAKECGAMLEAANLNGLELNDGGVRSRMRAFGPDAVLTMRSTGGTKDQFGTVLDATYDVRLMDVASNKTVWRASTKVTSGGLLMPARDRGASFAGDLMNRLKRDGIFHSCESQAPQK
jgi:hypothetical protein